MTREKSLLSSAKQFLIEALENHNNGKHDFAIVHAVTAAELLLKERLAKNPSCSYLQEC
jgi:HEPN domain-containing protein